MALVTGDVAAFVERLSVLPEMRVHIDRTEQIRLLTELVDGDPKSSAVVLLEGVALMGKSAFLVEISERLHDRATIVFTDLEDQPTVDDLLEDLAGKLDDLGVTLSGYMARSDELTTTGGIVVRDSKLHRSQLNLVTNSKETADLRQRALLREFVNDLRQPPARRLMILFDSYEKVGDELGNWFRGRMVPQLLRVPGLIVVLAGQRLPQLQRRPQPISLTLAPFDPEHVVEWLIKVRAPYLADEMRTVAHVLCAGNEGRPGRIDGFIQTLQRRGWGP